MLTCSTSSFPSNLSQTQCWGLAATPSDPMGRPITDASACLQACCAMSACTLWNFKPSESPPCWTWLEVQQPATCRPVDGWFGGSGRHQPPAPPLPPHAGPQVIALPETVPSSPPLHFVQVNATSPAGVVLSADNRSLLEDGQRIFPICGEVHVGRLPASTGGATLVLSLMSRTHSGCECSCGSAHGATARCATAAIPTGFSVAVAVCERRILST
mmetsp:Transcript_38341/g.89737  ORF Transcript_38341/g.89737 Transcript_38341/m.89737 type:complete len:215 (-) Transcript_38341:1255-1899(-)